MAPTAIASSPIYRWRKPRIFPALYSSAAFSSKRRISSIWRSSASACSRSLPDVAALLWMIMPVLPCSHALQGRDIPFGQPQLARLEQAAHDLAAARLWQALLEIDFLGRHHRAKPFPRVRHDVLLERIAWLIPGLERDESLYHLQRLSLIHISEPTRLGMISYA